MGNNTNRIYWIDNAKGLILLFVIMLHAHFPWSIVAYVSYWFMPCFFFISGLLFRMKDESLVKTLVHRSKTLLIPYFLLSVLFVFLNPNNYQGKILSHFISNGWDILMGNSGYATVSLWFVYVLFEVNCATAILHCFMRKLPRNSVNGLVIIVILANIVADTFCSDKILPFKLAEFFISWGMYLTGYLMSTYKKSIQETKTAVLAFSTILCLIISVTSYKYTYCGNIWGQEWLRCVRFLSGTLALNGIVLLCTKVFPENFIGMSLRFLANNAMCILAVHMWVICLCQQYMGTYSPYISAFLGLSVSLLLIPIFNKLMPWAVGKTS